MIQEHLLNEELSRKVYNECQYAVKKGECYNNIFRVMTHFPDKFMSNEWNIAYGFFTAIDNIMARHCYIINEENEVIDPTLIVLGSRKEEIRYISFAILEYKEYMHLLEEEKYLPALINSLIKKERVAYKWGLSRKIFFI